MLGVHVGDTELWSLAQHLGYAMEPLASSYLRFPLCLGKPRKELWDDLTQRFTWKFASWKGWFLSFGGRFILIRATLASIPVCYMSLFQLLISIIQRLEKINEGFSMVRSRGIKGNTSSSLGHCMLPKKILGSWNKRS
ncbi:hypothetical protein AMTRI_Chr05g73250 [Amborella trichopoda]